MVCSGCPQESHNGRTCICISDHQVFPKVAVKLLRLLVDFLFWELSRFLNELRRGHPRYFFRASISMSFRASTSWVFCCVFSSGLLPLNERLGKLSFCILVFVKKIWFILIWFVFRGRTSGVRFCFGFRHIFHLWMQLNHRGLVMFNLCLLFPCVGIVESSFAYSLIWHRHSKSYVWHDLERVFTNARFTMDPPP